MAGSTGEFVHIWATFGTSMQDTNGDVVGRESVTLKVTIGEDPVALVFPISSSKLLMSNVHLEPFEVVAVSSSDPSTCVVIHGVSSSKPMPF